MGPSPLKSRRAWPQYLSQPSTGYTIELVPAPGPFASESNRARACAGNHDQIQGQDQGQELFPRYSDFAAFFAPAASDQLQMDVEPLLDTDTSRQPQQRQQQQQHQRTAFPTRPSTRAKASAAQILQQNAVFTIVSVDPSELPRPQ